MQRKPTPEEAIIQNTLKDTDQSLDRMLAMLHDTKQIGSETLAELDKQGEQIGVVQDGLDEINYRDQIAKRQLRKISSIFWEIIYWLAPLPKWRSRIKERIEHNEVSSTAHIKKNLDADALANALKGTNSLDEYKKTDSKLNAVESEVKDLGKIANEMHKEIAAQNDQLEVTKVAASQAADENAVLIKKEKKLIKRFS